MAGGGKARLFIAVNGSERASAQLAELLGGRREHVRAWRGIGCTCLRWEWRDAEARGEVVWWRGASCPGRGVAGRRLGAGQILTGREVGGCAGSPKLDGSLVVHACRLLGGAERAQVQLAPCRMSTGSVLMAIWDGELVPKTMPMPMINPMLRHASHHGARCGPPSVWFFCTG